MARLADKIRQADDREVQIIDVDAWGVKIGVRSMTALQRSNMQNDWEADQVGAAAKLYSAVLLNCCFDPDTGETVFNEEDLEWLRGTETIEKMLRQRLVCAP